MLGRVVNCDARSHRDTPYTAVHRLVRRFLEPALDVLMVALALGLLLAMVRSLVLLVEHAVAPSVPVNLVLGETLFMLVLVELLRLLIIYLRDHRISVDVMVEVTIVGTLRQIAMQGPSALPAHELPRADRVHPRARAAPTLRRFAGRAAASVVPARRSPTSGIHSA